jgi:hypothetical protein
MTTTRSWLTHLRHNPLPRLSSAGRRYAAELPVVRPVTFSYVVSLALIPLLAPSSLWRTEPLGYVVGGMALLKAAAEGLTLVAQTIASQLTSGRGDDLLPAYVLVGDGGLVLLVQYLRSIQSRGATLRNGVSNLGRLA